jgi:hypothetical protein
MTTARRLILIRATSTFAAAQETWLTKKALTERRERSGSPLTIFSVRGI